MNTLTTHLFSIGQAVRLRRSFGRTSAEGIYRITGRLPASGSSPQYRIRNDSERHERVEMQDNLRPTADTDSLTTRTFGHG